MSFILFLFAASYQTTQGSESESDPNNTTVSTWSDLSNNIVYIHILIEPSSTQIFVGGLDLNVSEDLLRQTFSNYGELVHVKIPAGKRCGFVQFANRFAFSSLL